jgi:hypothetical protein
MFFQQCPSYSLKAIRQSLKEEEDEKCVLLYIICLRRPLWTGSWQYDLIYDLLVGRMVRCDMTFSPDRDMWYDIRSCQFQIVSFDVPWGTEGQITCPQPPKRREWSCDMSSENQFITDTPVVRQISLHRWNKQVKERPEWDTGNLFFWKEKVQRAPTLRHVLPFRRNQKLSDRPEWNTHNVPVATKIPDHRLSSATPLFLKRKLMDLKQTMKCQRSEEAMNKESVEATANGWGSHGNHPFHRSTSRKSDPLWHRNLVVVWENKSSSCDGWRNRDHAESFLRESLEIGHGSVKKWD